MIVGLYDKFEKYNTQMLKMADFIKDYITGHRTDFDYTGVISNIKLLEYR